MSNLCGLTYLWYSTLIGSKKPLVRYHDIQHKETQHNDIWHIDTQHKELMCNTQLK
jgi:hypothetical protein